MRRLTSCILLLAGALCAAAEPTVLRVVSYNIRTGGVGMDGKRDLLRQAEVLRALKPDVVLLQEVDLNAKRSGKVDCAGVIAQALGMRATFAEAMPFQGGSYGVAILTAIPAGKGPVRQLRFTGGTEPRAALILPLVVPVDGGHREILVACTHLDFRSADEVAPHAAELADVLAKDARPSILGGDLNFELGSPVLAAFEKRLTRVPKQGESASFPAPAPKVEIDHFFLNPSAAYRVRECRVVPESVASDHRPVLLEVELLSPAR